MSTIAKLRPLIGDTSLSNRKVNELVDTHNNGELAVITKQTQYDTSNKTSITESKTGSFHFDMGAGSTHYTPSGTNAPVFNNRRDMVEFDVRGIFDANRNFHDVFTCFFESVGSSTPAFLWCRQSEASVLYRSGDEIQPSVAAQFYMGVNYDDTNKKVQIRYRNEYGGSRNITMYLRVEYYEMDTSTTDF